MRTSSHDIGDGAVRVRPWPRPGRPATALLVLADHRARPPIEQIDRWSNDLRSQGYTHLRTGALEPGAARAFQGAGFEEAQRLALLRLDRPDPGEARARRTRAMRTAADDDTAATIDLAAFGAEWSFDPAAIADADRDAGARARFAVSAGAPVGYAITGRAGRHGFLQRLAVQPGAQREGHGGALVIDALRWLRRWRAQTVLVNTDVDNEAALRLYRRHGFRLLPEHLLVLERTL